MTSEKYEPAKREALPLPSTFVNETPAGPSELDLASAYGTTDGHADDGKKATPPDHKMDYVMEENALEAKKCHVG